MGQTRWRWRVEQERPSQKAVSTQAERRVAPQSRQATVSQAMGPVPGRVLRPVVWERQGKAAARPDSRHSR